MIKRIIACLTICLIVTGLISPVFSHAEPIPIYTPNWNDPGIAEIINISDLTGWMANGGVYDLTSFQDLDEFLTWYFKIRVPVQDEDGNITFAPTYGYESYLDSNYTSPRFIEQSNIRGMIARSYQNKTGYGRRLQEQVDKALLEDGDLSNINIPLLDKAESAFFVGYNVNAINQYRTQFLGDFVEPNPDINYSNFLSIINGTEVQPNYQYNFLRNSTVRSNFWPYIPEGVDFVVGNRTYYSCNYANNNFTNNPLSSQITFYNSVLTANVDSSTLSYSVTPSTDYWYPCSSSNDSNTKYNTCSGVSYNSNINGFECGWWKTGPDNGFQYNFSGFGNLNQVFADMAARWHNINIYVDGVPWSVLDTEDPTVPEFPDVVGGEELPITTWPLTVPKAPYYINLPGLRQAFQRAKNTDNQFDINDLVDSLVDPDGDPIVDPEMETVPIPLPNPDPINPEVVPELPDLPLIPPADNPGFSGVSVLAEIINFTNQSMPSSLITVFWGIVFGAVILGIIKILHK